MSTFDTAFNFVMKFEVGPWFDPTDPDVIAGLIETKEQRRKVGYVDDPLDRGGRTKFGVAQKSHPKTLVATITLSSAKSIFWSDYWVASRANELPGKWGIAHFDAAVNHGVKRANILLQRAVGADDDGLFGMGTLGKVLGSMGTLSAKQLLAPRRKFFHDIVMNDPTQDRFLKGWLSRVDALEKELT